MIYVRFSRVEAMFHTHTKKVMAADRRGSNGSYEGTDSHTKLWHTSALQTMTWTARRWRGIFIEVKTYQPVKKCWSTNRISATRPESNVSLCRFSANSSGTHQTAYGLQPIQTPSTVVHLPSIGKQPLNTTFLLFFSGIYTDRKYQQSKVFYFTIHFCVNKIYVMEIKINSGLENKIS